MTESSAKRLLEAVIRPRPVRIAGFAICALALFSACEGLLVRDPAERLWRQHCTECHGLDAAGNTPRSMGENYADLRDDSWNGGSDRYAIEQVIHDGVFAKMPAFDKLSKQEVDLLVAHLYKLRGETPQ